MIACVKIGSAVRRIAAPALVALVVAVSTQSVATSSSPGPVRYRLDASQSRVTARVFVGGLLAAFGHDHTVLMSGIRGEVQMTPVTIVPAAVQLVFDAKSAAEVAKEFDEKERGRINQSIQDEALQALQFPEITFKSTKISVTGTSENHCRATIVGDLGLHGITRSIEVPADVIIETDGITAQGQFQIRHSDFGIRQLSAAAGTVKAKDSITVNYKLVGTR